MDLISVINMVASSIIALVALVIGIKTYNFKRGQAIRGSFSICRSVDCDSNYIHEIELENCKDKAICIYSIYIRIGLDIYIELEEFKDKPLILNPFEVYKNKYDLINFYSVQGSIADLSELFIQNKKKKLILSTTNGRYIVRKKIKRWHPVSLFFKNHRTALIHIVRNTYEGRCYGNAKFLILATDKEGEVFKYAIGKNHFDIFRNFRITKNDIESKEKLIDLLQKQIDEGILNWTKFEIFEYAAWVNEYKCELYDSEPLKIKSDSNLVYIFIGVIQTIIDEIKLKKENREIYKRNRKRYKSSIDNMK